MPGKLEWGINQQWLTGPQPYKGIMRIRIIEDYAEYRKGQTVKVDAQTARMLLELKVARQDKMMTKNDYTVTKHG